MHGLALDDTLGGAVILVLRRMMILFGRSVSLFTVTIVASRLSSPRAVMVKSCYGVAGCDILAVPPGMMHSRLNSNEVVFGSNEAILEFA